MRHQHVLDPPARLWLTRPIVISWRATWAAMRQEYDDPCSGRWATPPSVCVIHLIMDARGTPTYAMALNTFL